MIQDTYILQKDLPDAKAGSKFVLSKDGDMYYLTSDKTGTRYNCYAYPKYFVENKSDWFLKEETTVTTKSTFRHWVCIECSPLPDFVMVGSEKYVPVGYQSKQEYNF